MTRCTSDDIRHLFIIGKIDARMSSRNWSALPNSFERDAVKFLFSELKPLFDKRDIRPRIKASQARTFSELRDACNSAKHF